MPKETWTQRDEIALAKMIDRRNRFYDTNRAPLLRMVEDDMPTVHFSQSDDIVSWMIKNAGELRDRLEPFDSGERLATVGRPEATNG